MDSDVKTTFAFEVTSIETPNNTIAPAAKSAKVTQNGFNENFTLNAASTPPAKICAYLDLTGGSGTIDLSALQTTFGIQDCTGLKLRGLLIVSPPAAAGTFTLEAGASNGYAIGGAALNVQPDGVKQEYFADGLLAIDGTHKELDWTNASGQPIEVALILG